MGLAEERSGADIVYQRHISKSKKKAKKAIKKTVETKEEKPVSQVYTAKGETLPSYVTSGEREIQLDETTKLIKARPQYEQEKERMIQRNLVRRAGEKTNISPQLEQAIATGEIKIYKRVEEKTAPIIPKERRTDRYKRETKLVEKTPFVYEGGIITSGAKTALREKQMIETQEKTGLSRGEIQDIQAKRIQIDRKNETVLEKDFTVKPAGILGIEGKKTSLASPKVISMIERQSAEGRLPTDEETMQILEGRKAPSSPFDVSVGIYAMEQRVREEEKERDKKYYSEEYKTEFIPVKKEPAGFEKVNRYWRPRIEEKLTSFAESIHSGIGKAGKFAKEIPFKSVKVTYPTIYGKETAQLNPLSRFGNFEKLEETVAEKIIIVKEKLQEGKISDWDREFIKSAASFPRGVVSTVGKYGEIALITPLLLGTREGRKSVKAELIRAAIETPRAIKEGYNPFTGGGAFNLLVTTVLGVKAVKSARARPVKIPQNVNYKTVSPVSYSRVIRRYGFKEPKLSIQRAGSSVLKTTRTAGGEFRSLEPRYITPRFQIDIGRAGSTKITRITSPMTGKTTIIATKGARTTIYKGENIAGRFTGEYYTVIQKRAVNVGLKAPSIKAISPITLRRSVSIFKTDKTPFSVATPKLISRKITGFKVKQTKKPIITRRNMFQAEYKSYAVKFEDIYKTGIFKKSKVTTKYEFGYSQQASVQASRLQIKTGLIKNEILPSGKIKRTVKSQPQRIRAKLAIGEAKPQIKSIFLKKILSTSTLEPKKSMQLYYFKYIKTPKFTAQSPTLYDIRAGTPLNYILMKKEGWSGRPILQQSIFTTVEKQPLVTIDTLKSLKFGKKGQLSLTPSLIGRQPVISVPSFISGSRFENIPYMPKIAPSMPQISVLPGLFGTLATSTGISASIAQRQRISLQSKTKQTLKYNAISLSGTTSIMKKVSITSPIFKPIQLIKTVPQLKTRTRQETKQVTGLRNLMRQRVRQRTITENIPGTSEIPNIPIITPPLPPTMPPPPPPIILLTDEDLTTKPVKYKKRKYARGFAYEPSIRALTLGIFGKKTKNLTGLEERPLPFSFKKLFRGVKT